MHIFLKRNNKMRVSEFIANRLAEFGVRHVFMLTGGGAMFLKLRSTP